MGIHVIHIMGASGSGTTTLGKAVSEEFGYAHLDTDDFYWEKTDPPYRQKREMPLRLTLLKEAMDASGKCVISGSISHWGDALISRFDQVIYIITPTAIRIKRIKAREFARFSNRILQGGDMYQAHQDFLEFAESYDLGGREMRSALAHQEWLKQMTCPILRVDGTLPTQEIFPLLFP